MDDIGKATCPHVVHAQLDRFLTEEVPKEAQDKVNSASSAEGEDEASFGSVS